MVIAQSKNKFRIYKDDMDGLWVLDPPVRLGAAKGWGSFEKAVADLDDCLDLYEELALTGVLDEPGKVA